MTGNQDFPVPFDLSGMIERFRAAIRHGGGILTVARNSGVPKGTLNNLLRGADIRMSNAYAIARTCDVSLDWLAEGKAEHWPQWYRAMMTGQPYTFSKEAPSPAEKPEQLHEPTNTIRPPDPLDTGRLRQAMEIIAALDGPAGLIAEEGPSKIARAYDILVGAKP